MSPFSERGLTLWTLGLALLFPISLLGTLTHPGPLADGNCVDFIWIWLSSHFAASAQPVRIFDYSAFLAAKNALVGPPSCVLEHFQYAPTFFFFVYPLHWLPYAVAFAVWLVATYAVYVAALYLIIPHRNTILLASTMMPVWWNIRLGHVGFLTAGLIGLALIFAESRPRLAGVFLALLTFKPQFGILFPPVLAISRNWRTLAFGAIASVIFFALAALAFGYETWPAFVRSVGERAAELAHDRTMAAPLASFLFLQSQGVSSEIAWSIQLTVSAIAAVIVCLIWAQDCPYSLKAAALAAGSLVASPHVISYDLCIMSIATAFFVKDALSRDFLRGERMTLLLGWLILLVFVVSPVPMLACFLLLGLTARRALCSPALEKSDAVGIDPLAAGYNTKTRMNAAWAIGSSRERGSR